MELKAQVFEVDRARARQSWRENTLKTELAGAEERERGGWYRGGKST